MQSPTFSDDKQSLPQRAKSWQRITKFKEHIRLSTNNMLNTPTTQSQNTVRSSFSPDTPTTPSRSAFSPWTRGAAAPKDLESGTAGLAKKPTLFASIAHKVLPSRTPETADSIHPLSPWPALKVTKRDSEEQRHNKRRRVVTFTIVTVIVLILLGAIIAIVVVLRKGAGGSSGADSGAPATLPAETTQCLTTFRVNAPSSPMTYPCGSCLPLLQAVPASFSTTNPADSDVVNAAVQFCALKSIFDSTGGPGTPGGSALFNNGWMKDTKICTWTGSSCNGRGQISKLELVTPGVPAAIPNEISALTSLESLKITGNGVFPAGRILTMSPVLRILNIVNTGIQGPLPDSLFTPASKLEQLLLVKNPELGTTLHNGIASMSALTSLVVNGQNLNMPLASIASSVSLAKTLVTLDLSSNAISAPLPDFSPLTKLVELNLSSNTITLLPPSSNFPPSLQVISLANNTGLLGTLPPSLCSNTALQTCNLGGTLFSSAPGVTCGKCQFT